MCFIDVIALRVSIRSPSKYIVCDRLVSRKYRAILWRVPQRMCMSTEVIYAFARGDLYRRISLEESYATISPYYQSTWFIVF